MFCPKCGKDGKDFKFCPYCGTEMPVLEETPEVWSVGMACPHCGGTKLEGKNCAFCGAQLMLDVPGGEEDDVSDQLPCGKYRGVSSSVALHDDACVIERRPIFKKYTTRIPYDKLTGVQYTRPAYSGSENGYLRFRWEGNKELELPWRSSQGIDKTEVVIPDKDDIAGWHNDIVFYHIFCALKTVAPPSAEFLMDIPSVDMPELEELSKSVDLDDYFLRHAPHRKHAEKELRRRTGVDQKIAKALIGHAFDARQKRIYDTDPTAAIRDLNRVLKEQA